MSSSLAYSDFNHNNFSIIEKKKAKNKTIKKENIKSDLSAIINKIHNNNDDNSDLADFKPPSIPKSETTEDVEDINLKNVNVSEEDNSITPTMYNNLKSSQAEDYYKANVPYYTQMSSTSFTNKDELIDKLDKILILLEENRDEKTGHVTEEVILYSFIGVFLIFIVDSFARVGKYVR